ncbi:MAG TPA: hypothetical protein VFN64_00765 [Burkholderiaceae bacterium]|nr:hypothetical protein [Burkholderiaceae bacterium]
MLTAAGLTDAYWFTHEGRERGRAIHAVAADVFDGREVAVAPVHDGYLKALVAAYRALRFAAICVERRLFDGDVTGRPDAVGWLAHPIGRVPAGPAIVDVKSGDRSPAHGIQLALYANLADALRLRHLLPPEYRDLPWQRLGLYVRSNGRYALHHYDDDHDYRIAEAILDLTRWRLAHGLLRDDGLTFSDDPETPDGDDRPDEAAGPGEPGDGAVPAAGAGVARHGADPPDPVRR